MAESIRVAGLAEFNRGLRKLDADAPKALRVALNGVATFVADETRPEIPTVTGAAARSLVARSTRTSARVAVGGRRAPYYPWLDFGGRTGRNRSVVRPFYREGRYLYPTVRRVRPRILSRLRGALVAVAQGAGLDVD